MADLRRIGKYEIVEEIGRGGFAAVYKARDLDLDRVVALKVLAPHLTWDATFAKRFRREAQATAKLRHPNIVTIYEVDETEGQLYIAMEHLPGRTLAALLKAEGAMPLERALVILEQIGDALDYAHEQGAIHRDVKPSNVMIGEDRRGAAHAILMDFGLVKAMESSESLTSLGTILGSPQYMAPEQADPTRKGEIGPPTDRYALGVVAYEVVAGRVPFPGSTPSTLVAHMQQAPPDPRSIRETLPANVAQVLLKALSKSPEERYPTVMAMVEALRIAMQPELHPSVAIRLAAERQIVDADEEVAWTVTVLNDGGDQLRRVTVRHRDTLIDKPFDLAAGKERDFTFITTYQTEGEKTEKVTVTGTATDGEKVHAEASGTVQVRPPLERPITQPVVAGKSRKLTGGERMRGLLIGAIVGAAYGSTASVPAIVGYGFDWDWFGLWLIPATIIDGFAGAIAGAIGATDRKAITMIAAGIVAVGIFWWILDASAFGPSDPLERASRTAILGGAIGAILGAIVRAIVRARAKKLQSSE
jgi:serine/threonine protein kinase